MYSLRILRPRMVLREKEVSDGWRTSRGSHCGSRRGGWTYYDMVVELGVCGTRREAGARFEGTRGEEPVLPATTTALLQRAHGDLVHGWTALDQLVLCSMPSSRRFKRSFSLRTRWQSSQHDLFICVLLRSRRQLLSEATV